MLVDGLVSGQGRWCSEWPYQLSSSNSILDIVSYRHYILASDSNTNSSTRHPTLDLDDHITCKDEYPIIPYYTK